MRIVYSLILTTKGISQLFIKTSTLYADTHTVILHSKSFQTPMGQGQLKEKKVNQVVLNYKQID